MRPTALVLAFALSACAAPAAAQLPQQPHAPGADRIAPPQIPPAAPAMPRTLRVSADGRVSTRPDVALVQAGVQVTAKDPQKASADANARMKALLAELQKQGIAEKDVQTSQFSLTAERPWENGRQLPIQGYTATSTVRVKVRKLEQLPVILGRLPAVGVNDVQSVQFGREELGPVRDEALALAVGAAKARAQAVAKAAGVTLGEVISIDVQTQPPVMPMGANVAMMRGMAKDESAPVAEGELEVTAGVDMTFAIR